MTTDADGWIEHDGKGMPVDGETVVDVQLRDIRGSMKEGPYSARTWGWAWKGRSLGTITHYRIVDEAKPAAVDPVWATSVGQTSAIREIDHFLSEQASGFVNGISKTHLRHWRTALSAVSQAGEATPETGYVLVKRGLYYRPNAQGYTGILAQAGIYSDEESARRIDEEGGVTRVKFANAAEVASSTWMDIQRDYWREEALRLRAMMTERAK